MEAERFDQFAKAYVALGSRRWVMGGLLAGVLGLSRIGAVRATHKPGHHCTPSDNHPCETCDALREVCTAPEECCQDEPTSCEPVTAAGCAGSGEARCCHPFDGSCTTDCDCCDFEGISQICCEHPPGVFKCNNSCLD